MLKVSFDQAYSNLNDCQRLAVNTLDGPVIVIAGPGTGKTQVLTLRIANILKKTDTSPENILALTFTEAAAREMKDRLISMIGRPGYFVNFSTFHSFCADIIAENPERFSHPRGSQNLTDLEKIQIITQILERGTFNFLKPLNAPLLYLRDIIASLSDLKREGITPDQFHQIVKTITNDFDHEKDNLKKTAFLEKEKFVGKNLDLLSIYTEYQTELKNLGRFDYEDMINWVIEAFESDPDFLLRYQEKYQYLLADEYQDTNSAQNRLLFALAAYWGDHANIFVVGDPNQSIFRFQGASQENLLQFRKRFPGAVEISLTENYRSTQTLLQSAAALLDHLPLNHHVSYLSKKIKVAKFSSSLFEDHFLIKSIQKKILLGLSPSDIAVIVKENRDLDHLATLFKKASLPFRLEGGVNILTTPLVQQFIKILDLVSDLSRTRDDLELFTVFNYPFFKLDPLTVLKFARHAHNERQSLLDYLQSGGQKIDSKIVDLFNLFVSWNHQTAFHTLPEIFQIILQESGLLDFILHADQPLVELNRFNTLYEDLKSQVSQKPNLTLIEYLANLTTMLDHGLKLEEDALDSGQPAVTLTTAHKSKGLEWLAVYIYRFADTHWGNKTHRQMIKLPAEILEQRSVVDDKNAEEKRLFYVALTRAKGEVYLTGATVYKDSAKMVFPALFLSDLPSRWLTHIETKKYESSATTLLQDALTSTTTSQNLSGENDYLQELLTHFRLSPTALNTYLECHYKFKLDHLYRIPRAKAPSMCFGTAVHFALESLYRRFNLTGHLPEKKTFLKDFKTALIREVMTDSEMKDRLAHGLKILSAYYDHYQSQFTKTLFTEKNFGHKTPILLEDIMLAGKADRIDLIDQSKNTVRFIDYKTGNPKTRGVLDKVTLSSEGNYKRQLIFYHLLADLDKSFKYRITETELDFIEPDKSGNFHRERFNITKDEIDLLKQTIKDSVTQIRALDFEKTEDTSLCARCDFKSHCWPNGISENAHDFDIPK